MLNLPNWIYLPRKLQLTKDRRSPLKSKPLRNPGQSLDEQIHDLISDYALAPAVFALFIVLITVLEWLKYYRSIPPAPFLYSVAAVLAVGYALIRFFRVRRAVKGLRLGKMLCQEKCCVRLA